MFSFKKIALLLSFCFLFVNAIHSQNVSFSDANLKAALIADLSINTNGDSEIQITEAQSYTDSIIVPLLSISSMDGIEEFTAITYLDCSHNPLFSLDVSFNTNLVTLNCSSTKISSLDVSNNTALEVLDCNFNTISSLDLTNNPNLTYLDCFYNNLSALDITNQINLTELICTANSISSLDLSNCTGLLHIKCASNALTNLDFSNNLNITHIYAEKNNLSTLNITNNTALKVVDVDDNNLTAIDITNLPGLDSLSVLNNQLTALDISNNGTLKYLNCGYNDLSVLNTTNNTNLITLRCHRNQLTSLDISNNLLLDSLDFNTNQIAPIDLSNNSNLSYLDCGYNPILTLDVTNNLLLEVLYGDYLYSFTSSTVDVSNNDELKKLRLRNITTLTNLDVSNNFNLETLECQNNAITSLNLGTTNANLDYINCADNQLDTLPLGNFPALTQIVCSNNNIQALDLNTVDSLEILYCTGNQLKKIDVRHLENLQILGVSNNFIKLLDLSKNTKLNLIHCQYNELEILNLKNGNNTQISDIRFNAENNPDLQCIQVDNVLWSLNNWTQFEPWTSFAVNCFYNSLPNTVSGKIIEDTDCTIDSTETPYPLQLVRTTPDFFYSITDSSGNYTLHIDSGSYEVLPIFPSSAGYQYEVFCPGNGYHTIQFDTLDMDTTNINFHVESITCYNLFVDISSNRRRRCFSNKTRIVFANKGVINSPTDTKIHLKLPEYVKLLNASSPYTITGDSTYEFLVGALSPGEYGQIIIEDSVACESGITGIDQCTKAWITPSNDCIYSNSPDYSSWDGSSLSISHAECSGDTMLLFEITNNGTGNMSTPSEYRIYADNEIVHTNSLLIESGESIEISTEATGMTYRLEVDQSPNYPGNSQPRITITGCGNGGAPLNTGLVNQVAMDDANLEIETECLPIIDSYDPNDKNVSPKGITNNRYVKQGTQLEYVIRFQNTGTDTAYKVIVVDTLSHYIDPSTLQFVSSSAPYTIDVSGHKSPTLIFTFNNIDLPDSTTNESESHGYIKFKAYPYDTTPEGTVIHNQADIFFDYNEPIRTNDAWIEINNFVPSGIPISVQEEIITGGLSKAISPSIYLYPNPFKNSFYLELPESITGKDIQLKLTNVFGQSFETKYTFNGKVIAFNGTKLKPGMYFLKIMLSGEELPTIKIIKQ